MKFFGYRLIPLLNEDSFFFRLSLSASGVFLSSELEAALISVVTFSRTFLFLRLTVSSFFFSSLLAALFAIFFPIRSAFCVLPF